MVSKPLLSLAIILAVVLCSPIITGCVQTTVSGSPPPKSRTKKFPKTPPNEVVKEFLSALEGYDFKKAYKFISTAYASNLDPDSYALDMKKGLVETLHWSLLKYEVLSVRILGNQAFVIAEMSVKYTLPTDEEPTLKNIRVQYALDKIDSKWIIARDTCILNCESPPGLGMKEVRPLKLSPVEEPKR